MKLIKEDYQELNNGDEIIYNKEHLYILDKDYSDEYAWVTDEEEDRFNKNAPGWTLKKDYINEVIGQDDLLEELDYKFNPEIIDTSEDKFFVSAEDFYDSGWKNKKSNSIDQLHINESLHGFNQIQEFLNLCDAMGMKTIDDIQRFMEEHPGEDVMKALQNFRRELGPKFKIANKERGLYGAKKTSVFNDYINPELDPNSFENSKWMDFDDDIDESLIEGLNKSFEEDLNNNFKPNIQSSTNSFSPASKSSVLEDIRKNIQFVKPESQINNLNNNSNTILDVANPDMVYDDEI